MDDWANIPSVILMKILSYLSNRDRVSCSSVCRQWYDAVNSPILWKDLVVYLDTDLTDPMTVLVTKKYAYRIKNLNLAWSRPFLPRRWIRNRMTTVSHDTCNFLAVLRDANISLASFRITDWYFAWKFKRVLYFLIQFLRHQRELLYLDLSSACLDKSDIMKILLACHSSALSLRSLNLTGAFYEWHYLFSNFNFGTVINQFSRLEVLKLDYSSISEQMLSTFIETGNSYLKLIEINIKDSDTRSHTIRPFIWKKLSALAKNLEVAFHIQNLCHYEDIYYILCNSIPLTTFTLNCGPFWNQSRSRNYCGLLSLLTNNYSRTLRHVVLQLRNNKEMIDYFIYQLISHCHGLQYFEFDGILRNLELFKDLCNFQCYENVQGFKFLHVRPKNTSIYNNLLLSEIWRTYVHKMEKSKINFEIESFNIAAVRIFC